MCVIRPSTGVRLICTSIGERKIVICFQSPGGAQRPSVGPAIMTRPSAGETTSPGSEGTCRSGSKKVREESSRRGEGAGPAVAPGEREPESRSERASDERNACLVDVHESFRSGGQKKGPEGKPPAPEISACRRVSFARASAGPGDGGECSPSDPSNTVSFS